MIAAVSSCWALLLGIALIMMGNGLQGSLLGVRASLEAFPTAVTGVVMSGYFVGFLAGSVLAPKLVARVGHVRVFAALASLASTSILIHAVWIEPAAWTALRLVTGFCYAGLYVVAESWLNDRATNRTRGQLLSIYMLVMLGGAGAGQGLLNVADPSGPNLFILISILVSLALIPILLSAARTPSFDAPAPIGMRELYRVSPTGVVGIFGTMLANGAYFGMGAVYASEIGLSVRDVSLFMGAILIGGMVLQWPIGRVSDAMDRRHVLAAVTLLAAMFALGASVAIDGSRWPLFALVGLFGGMNLPLYSLCIAYTNDYLRHDQIVNASGTLVLIGGIAASFGPLTAAFAMQSFGPAAFFWWLAVIHASIGAFALYRMTRRASLPLEEQGSYVAVPPRATSTATAMYSEMSGADGPRPEAVERPSVAGG